MKPTKIFTSEDLRNDAKQHPGLYKATTAAKWRGIANALERILEKAQVRCGYCMIQLDADSNVYCDDCSLFTMGICGFQVRPGRMIMSSELHNTVRQFYSELEFVLKLATKIRNAVMTDCGQSIGGAHDPR